MKTTRRPSRDIPDRVLKTLFALSGNQCAFPGCDEHLLAEPGNGSDSTKVLGEIAHIVPHGDEGPRSDPTFPKERLNEHDNLILLCPNCHHGKVDAFPHQYNVQVLRQMKRDHEAQFRQVDKPMEQPRKLVEDEIFASALHGTKVPSRVYSAETEYRKQNAINIWHEVVPARDERDTVAFELSGKRIWAFHDLRKRSNPFSAVCEPSSTRINSARDMWDSVDERRLYTSLLNRALTNHLRSKGIRYHPKYRRYYFRPDPKKTERSIPYRTLTGQSRSRGVVWNPKTRVTGKGKRYWIHLAARVSFQYVGGGKWILAIRPERYLTRDGHVEFESELIGRKVTRLKATMHNRDYLGEVHLWASVLCKDCPRLSLRFGNQWLVVENRLLESSVQWRGIPDDDKAFTERQPEEDLFSWAESSEISEELDAAEGEEYSENGEE